MNKYRAILRQTLALREKAMPLSMAAVKVRLLRREVISTALLVVGFVMVVVWFGTFDFYHKHFFDHGRIVREYNIFRILFVCLLAWIIYAPGAALLATTVRIETLREFSPVERAVLGFGTGFGLWQVVLLVLGILDLYTRSVMVGLCVVVLVTSGRHFSEVVVETGRLAVEGVSNLRRGKSTISMAVGFLIFLTMAWLLLARGLPPGGGHDYYTHYFYYYQEVIRNHGLAPNDLWYHYYYSKGAGLTFLAILLTDPEAPQLVTFCSVIFAAAALAGLSGRLAPNSLWPAVGSVLYLISYGMIPMILLGGEFQKSHEEMTALVVIVIWSTCMYALRPRDWELPCLIAGASGTIGATILEQPIGAFFIAFFGLMTAWALVKRRSRQAWAYGLLCAGAGIALLAVLLLNYLVTGLATDQAMDLVWRFADLERLDRWGVIPYIVLSEWIRDNYAITPFGWASVDQLINFMRLDRLWVLAGSGCIALVVAIVTQGSDASRLQTLAVRQIVASLSILIVVFALISILVGHTQVISFYRFSSFFFPLVTLFGVTSWSLLAVELEAFPTGWFLRVVVPGLLLIAVPYSWHNFSSQLRWVTANGINLASGKYSLADGYVQYGGINPRALAAFQRVPHGSRIWSINADSYCMAPECRIETYFSFKMSSHFNEILFGPSDQARRILEQEGLNYFLFSSDSPFGLSDLLPFSQLFDPAHIGENLAIKWTDGKMYLLTWKGSETEPIGEKFLLDYNKLRDGYAAKMRQAKYQLGIAMNTLSASPHPWRPIEFPWRVIPPGAPDKMP